MDREEFKKEAKKRIDEFAKQIDNLEHQTKELKSEAAEEYQEKITELKNQKQKLESKYEEVQSSSDLNWDIIHETFEETAESVKNGVAELQEAVS